eukprot:tig00001067_g6766.t1
MSNRQPGASAAAVGDLTAKCLQVDVVQQYSAKELEESESGGASADVALDDAAAAAAEEERAELEGCPCCSASASSCAVSGDAAGPALL